MNAEPSRFIPARVAALLIVLVLSACGQSPSGKSEGIPTFDAKVEFTGIGTVERGPGWLDERTIAYQQADGMLVIADIRDGSRKEVREIKNPPCTTLDGRIRVVVEHETDAGRESRVIELSADGEQLDDLGISDGPDRVLLLAGCRLVERKSLWSGRLPLPISSDGYAHAEQNEGGATVRSNLYTPEGHARLDKDLLYHFADVQYLPWRNDYFISATAWKGFLELYLVDREGWTVETITKPVRQVPSTSHYLFSRVGLIYLPQFFRRGLTEPRLAGLYWVDPASGELREIISGQVILPSVSPDGCTIAAPYRPGSEAGLRQAPELVLIDVCIPAND